MVECSRCGGEMVEGELYAKVPVTPGNPMMGSMMPIPAVSMGGIVPSEETGLRWREKTGERKGFLFKSDEVRTFTIKGRRCRGCGHIELYAGDEIY